MSERHADEPARKDFSLSFRGFDQHEVRAHLSELAAELSTWRARVDELEARVAELEATPPADLDEAALEMALGREATRVIHAAREAASDIRTRAESEAAAKLAEAEASASSMRAEVDDALEALREDAERRAAAIKDEATAHAKALVAKATNERDRVLQELATRRESLVAELERLHDARVRLSAAFDAVRGALDPVATEVADADVAATAVRDGSAPAALTVRGSDAPAPEEPAALREPEPEPEPEPVADAEPLVEREPVPAEEPDRRSSSLKLVRPDVGRGTPVAPPAEDAVEGVRIIRPEPEPEPQSDAEPEPTATEPEAAETDGAVDGLFARLRADRAEKVANAEAVLAEPIAPAAAAEGVMDDAPPADDASTAEVAPDLALLATRDEALAADERSLVRALKRALADEQNEVLDGLRRLKGAPTVAALLPDRPAHDARFEEVLRGGVAAAAASGGSAAGGDGGTAAVVASDLASSMVGDLRTRVERAIDEASGDVDTLAEAISAAYREWKTARTDPLARDAIAGGFAAGLYAATSGPLRWVVDPAEGGCPDCDDNALAGSTAKGSAFPTGQLHPPAHAGCRCIVVASD